MSYFKEKFCHDSSLNIILNQPRVPIPAFIIFFSYWRLSRINFDVRIRDFGDNKSQCLFVRCVSCIRALSLLPVAAASHIIKASLRFPTYFRYKCQCKVASIMKGEGDLD